MAVVELAFCLPVIVLVIFGGIQAANLIFLKQAITEAAYEGALFGSRPEATHAETLGRVQAILDARNIQDTTVVAGNGASTIDQLVPGQLLSIRVSASAGSNLIGPQVFSMSSDVGAEIFARKL